MHIPGVGIVWGSGIGFWGRPADTSYPLKNLTLYSSCSGSPSFFWTSTLDPKNVETEFYLGILAVQQNKGPDAIIHLEKYIASSPSNAANVATAQGLLQALKKK